MRRTHTCGQLTNKETDKEVVLEGWVATRRDHGGVIFIDLRDRYGLTQVVFNPEPIDTFNLASKLRREDCIMISGKVRERPKGMENKNIHTGQIEVLSSKIEIYNQAETPPFEIGERVTVGEELSLKYRYLDLRNNTLKNNIILI